MDELILSNYLEYLGEHLEKFGDEFVALRISVILDQDDHEKDLAIETAGSKFLDYFHELHELRDALRLWDLIGRAAKS